MKFRGVILAGLTAVVTAASAGVLAGIGSRATPADASPSFHSIPVSVHASPPLSNTASAGRVIFTFDDGPDQYTQALLTELKKLRVPAVFFVFGWKALAHPALIHEELADGDVIENHTWDHLSFTGASTGTAPLPAAKIQAELSSTQRALISLGVPAPRYYRPPFGDITPQDNAVAASLGLKIMQPFSVIPDGNITDSRDWTGANAAQITHDVTHGYYITQDGQKSWRAGIKGGSVIGFHDSSPGNCNPTDPLCADVKQTILALPGIVTWMNAHHLGATVRFSGSMTGGMDLSLPTS
jgi:peptidoglycan/xylan/chitin deacetylase (PgdA/CDA1 family)